MISAQLEVNGEEIPVLFPTRRMRETARQIGLAEHDLFSIDNPVGMSRHLRAKILVANDKLPKVYAGNPCDTVLRLNTYGNDALGVRFMNLTPRPAQPIFWGENGGVAMVELVDQRYFWQFTSAASFYIEGQILNQAFSSDGRNLVNHLTSVGSLLELIYSFAKDNFDISETTGGIPVGFTEPETQYLTRIADLFGTTNISLAVLIDTIAATTNQVICKNSKKEHDLEFVQRDTLMDDYDGFMAAYQVALRGGSKSTNRLSIATADPLVQQWDEYGYEFRCPRDAHVVSPARRVEGKTVYNNCTTSRTPIWQHNFVQESIYANDQTADWEVPPTLPGKLCIPSSQPVAYDENNDVITTLWDPELVAAAVTDDVVRRYENVPFGRTMLAGWHQQTNGITARKTLGQIGMVSYRLAEVDDKMVPHTMLFADEDDWIFGHSGKAMSNPQQVISVKGKGQAYSNTYGATIIDVPPPNTRVFPAYIMDATQIETWKWSYTFVEVEPNPSSYSPSWTAIGKYARGYEPTVSAVNMAENYNVFVGVGNSQNRIAPGVKQSDYASNVKIEAVPIQKGVIVEMVEQFDAVSAVDGESDTSPPPRFWFSMPNAVKVICTQ